jgi:hypothetical protein
VICTIVTTVCFITLLRNRYNDWLLPLIRQLGRMSALQKQYHISSEFTTCWSSWYCFFYITTNMTSIYVFIIPETWHKVKYNWSRKIRNIMDHTFMELDINYSKNCQKITFYLNHPEDGNSKHLLNSGNHVPLYMASYLRRQKSLSAPLWEPQIFLYKAVLFCSFLWTVIHFIRTKWL